MLRVIIVDDEALSLKRLSRILSESGEVVICQTFQNPLEAYEYARNNPIDVAFLDISMPEISGMKLSKQLHQLYEAMDIVFVTGYEEYAIQAFDISATDYLLKPVSAERVMQALHKIRKRPMRREVEPLLEVHMFGGLKLTHPGPERKSLKLRSPKTEELFAFLLYKRSVSRDEIMDTLWSGFESDKASNNLNSNLYYIRKAIGDYGLKVCLLTDRNEVQIVENSLFCDLYAFERLLREIRLNRDGRKELLKQAVALYTGSFLKGKTYEWASTKARRLEQDYMELLELAARLFLEQHQVEQALQTYDEILLLDGLREDITGQVLRLLIDLGRTSEAIRRYRRLEEVLLQELGTRPSRPIRELMHRLNA
ncbi:response regulator [Paenibacillus sp. MMS20-IR301]|uniref:response regulator n=1 Tax=Paenibacillus sp. MMS20-IR301 TaxID=2895946 RepID=UPI0028EE32E8|nr:response regulator [Paenibacillus sp. MMS20-IR301]WNS41498.1 response regulator [Paenibacillus sp. MMS20-IR301]